MQISLESRLSVIPKPAVVLQNAQRVITESPPPIFTVILPWDLNPGSHLKGFLHNFNLANTIECNCLEGEK